MGTLPWRQLILHDSLRLGGSKLLAKKRGTIIRLHARVGWRIGSQSNVLMIWKRKYPLLCARLAVVFSMAMSVTQQTAQLAAQPVVALGQNFAASTLNVDTSALPPDPDGAVGPLHYVELVNGRFSVFNKTDHTKVKTMTDLTFWSQAGITIPSSWDVTDPRIVFDTASQRWFASQVDFDPSGAINTNRFLLAVSSTADPTGTWHAVFIPSDPGGNDFADFPTLGVDAVGVSLSGDMFDVNGNPVGPTLVFIPKASLLANPPTTSGMTSFGVMSYNTRGNILQPVMCFDGSGQRHILAVGSVGIDDSGNFVTNHSLLLSQVKPGSGPGQATLTSATLTVPPYTVPFDPAQPDGSSNLDDGDARISACVYEVGGVVYAAHSTQLGNLAVIRWYRIDPIQQTVLESGTINDPVKDLYYPSIAANASGTVVIAYNGSSLTTFPSSFAVVGNTINGLTTFGQPVLLASGTASYQNTDSSGTSRWGDYSSLSVDPTDPTRFWTIQEIATGASVWSTHVTEIMTADPQLFISGTSTNLSVSWSGSFLTLQATDQLGNPSWTTVSTGLSTNLGVVTAQLPLTANSEFFRLQGP